MRDEAAAITTLIVDQTPRTAPYHRFGDALIPAVGSANPPTRSVRSVLGLEPPRGTSVVVFSP
jgi:hypothetical protein